MTIFSIIDPLSKALVNLPGKVAHQKMITIPRAFADPPYSESDSKPAAVLILLFPDKKDIRFFLTKRTHDVAHHKGQISLPGGAQENSESLSNTALRETEEEIGINSSKISIIGNLSSLFIPFTGFTVHPFIGWMKNFPTVSPDTNEVSHLFSVSIYDLINDENVKQEKIIYQEQKITLPYYHLKNEKVWGATAMILSEFKTILRKLI